MHWKTRLGDFKLTSVTGSAEITAEMQQQCKKCCSSTVSCCSLVSVAPQTENLVWILFVSPDAGTSGEEPSESVAEPVAAAPCPATASPSAPSASSAPPPAPSAPHHSMENHAGNLFPVSPHLHCRLSPHTVAPGMPAPTKASTYCFVGS